MLVLVACEESQEVCKAFRALGHEAYSADIQEPSGGRPEWHILGDVLPFINGRCTFQTMDGQELRGTYQGLIYAGGVYYEKVSRNGDNRYCALGAPDHGCRETTNQSVSPAHNDYKPLLQ
jgi:hypothetical protein